MIDHHSCASERIKLGLLICVHVVICCISLVHVARFDYPGVSGAFFPATSHIFYDPARLHDAVAVVAGYAVISFLFSVARFSFGYFVGFNSTKKL